MALVPQGLSSIEAALAEGAAEGVVAARRQAVGVHASRPTRGAASTRRRRPFFHALVDEYDASGLDDAAPAHAARDAGRRAPPRRTRRSGASSSRSTRRAPTSTIRSGASATRCTRRTSTASSSTSTRPTRGAGTSCTASSTRWARSRERIMPGADVDDGDRAPRDAIRHARSRASTRSSAWIQDLLDTHRRRARTARTSTSPSRCSASRR